MVAFLEVVRLIAPFDFFCLPLLLFVSFLFVSTTDVMLSSSSNRIMLNSDWLPELGMTTAGELGGSSSESMIVSSLTAFMDRFLEIGFALGVILSNMTDSKLDDDLSDGAGELANKRPGGFADKFRVVIDRLIDLLSGLCAGLFSMMNFSASVLVANFL